MAPPIARRAAVHGEPERGLALRAAVDRGAGEETPAQRHELTFLKLAETALEQDAEVVGGDGQVIRGLGGPKRLAAKSDDAELTPELLDPILHVRSPIVAAPHRHRRH